MQRGGQSSRWWRCRKETVSSLIPRVMDHLLQLVGHPSTGRPAFQPSSKAPGISTRYGIDDSGSAEPKNWSFKASVSDYLIIYLVIIEMKDAPIRKFQKTRIMDMKFPTQKWKWKFRRSGHVRYWRQQDYGLVGSTTLRKELLPGSGCSDPWFKLSGDPWLYPDVQPQYREIRILALVVIFARRRFQRDILYIKVTRSRETRHYSKDSTAPVLHSRVCIFCDLTGGALKNRPDQKRKLVISMFTSLDRVEHQWSQILLIL